MAESRTGLWQMFLGSPSARFGHTDALDGLRGLAVLVVIASHLSHARMGLVPGIGLAGIGKSGVYLFFVLSAFLLTRPLLERAPADFANGRLWANYALRRVLRIWPLYLAVLLLSWWLTMDGVAGWYYQLDTPALLRHLALREGQGVLWSIPVEFKYYLWLPLVALGLAWTRRRAWPLLAELAVAAVLLALVAWVWPPSETGPNDVRLGPYLAMFLCGGFAARIDQRLQGRRIRRWAWGLAGLVALLAFVLSIPEVWSGLTGQPVDRRFSHHWFLYFALAWSTLLMAVLHGPSWLRAPFAWTPMRLMGVVSFSAYLWHMPVIRGMRALGVAELPLAPLLVLGGIVLASMASFLLFERPWREVRLRVSSPARQMTW